MLVFIWKILRKRGCLDTLLLDKIERAHKILCYFSRVIPDTRNPLFITHTIEKLLKQRVYMLMQGYEDANDVSGLQLTQLVLKRFLLPIFAYPVDSRIVLEFVLLLLLI